MTPVNISGESKSGVVSPVNAAQFQSILATGGHGVQLSFGGAVDSMNLSKMLWILGIVVAVVWFLNKKDK